MEKFFLIIEKSLENIFFFNSNQDLKNSFCLFVSFVNFDNARRMPTMRGMRIERVVKLFFLFALGYVCVLFLLFVFQLLANDTTYFNTTHCVLTLGNCKACHQSKEKGAGLSMKGGRVCFDVKLQTRRRGLSEDT